MGVAYYRVSCNKCSFAQDVYGTYPGYYWLRDKLFMPIWWRFAWCHGCETLAQVEQLWPEKEISDELWRAGAGLPYAIENWARDSWRKTHLISYHHSRLPREEHIGLLQEMLRWRKARESPPRCLACGSTSIRDLPHDTYKGFHVPHANCASGDGVISFESEGMSSIMSEVPWEPAWDAEGLRVGIARWMKAPPDESKRLHFFS